MDGEAHWRSLAEQAALDMARMGEQITALRAELAVAADALTEAGNLLRAKGLVGCAGIMDNHAARARTLAPQPPEEV